VALAKAGVESDMDRVRAEEQLNAQRALVESAQKNVDAAQADLNSAVARTHQQRAAASNVAANEAQVANARAQLVEAETRLGYTKIYAPVSGTVSVRATRQGEVVNPGEAIVTIVDFGDTWVRADAPEILAFLRGHVEAIRGLVKSKGDPVFEGRGGAREAGTTVSVVTTSRGPVEVLVGLKGFVAKDDEIARIDREMKKVDKDVSGLEKRLASSGFVDRAPPEGPPVWAALKRPFGMPPPISNRMVRSVVPMGTSIKPVLAICPARAKTFVPLLFSVPMEAYQSPPLLMMGGILANVSTLLMSVGAFHKPDSGG
jgi:biotin carboxyl carrier protein